MVPAMSEPIQSCMGGFRCTKRDFCQHYLAASPRQTPVERMCPPGHDGEGPMAPRVPLQQPVEWPALGLPKT